MGTIDGGIAGGPSSLQWGCTKSLKLGACSIVVGKPGSEAPSSKAPTYRLERSTIAVSTTWLYTSRSPPSVGRGGEPSSGTIDGGIVNEPPSLRWGCSEDQQCGAFVASCDVETWSPQQQGQTTLGAVLPEFRLDTRQNVEKALHLGREGPPHSYCRSVGGLSPKPASQFNRHIEYMNCKLHKRNHSPSH